MKILADATNIMAEGEALQLLDRHKAETTENAYLNVIRCKTAKLFEASAQIGAILANADSECVLAMTHFGIHLGTAFQLVDDVLDYRASPDKTGKNLGNDLAEGKITLPLIHILKNGTAEEIQLVKEAIREGGHEHFSAVQKIIETSDSIEYTLDFADLEITRAKKALDNLDPSPYKEAAFALANFALKRDR
jgi:octaprenyl-diphosphate synthase